MMNATSRPLFKHLHKKGIHIMFYAVCEEKVYKRCIDKYYPHLDGFITDKASTLNTFLINNSSLLTKLKKHPQWGRLFVN